MKAITLTVLGATLFAVGGCANRTDHGARPPVMVLGYGGHAPVLAPDAPGSSAAAGAFRKQFARRDFAVIDPDFAGIDTAGIATKADAIEAARLADNSGTRIRYLVLYNARRATRQNAFATVYTLRLSGAVYDMRAHQLIGSFDAGPNEYSAPADCDSPCLESESARPLRALARTAADRAVRQLRRAVSRKDSPAPQPGTRPITGDGRFQ